jgi:hypothetical protein
MDAVEEETAYREAFRSIRAVVTVVKRFKNGCRPLNYMVISQIDLSAYIVH